MIQAEDIRGFVFNIQHYSIHDGPGIRTTVFVTGCPLRCIWCQNPESQSLKPQLFFTLEKCTGCGDCVQVCPCKAITVNNGKSHTDRGLCQGTGECVAACPNEARTIMGKEMTATEVFHDVIADKMFYETSGGGVTISGGEPLAQPGFTTALLQMCKNAGLSTALDTCGCADWNTFKNILPYVDIVLFDFKHMDTAAHQKLTGVNNESILENAVKIVKEFLDISFIARIPIVPDCNDSSENIKATARFIKGLGKPVKVHLLPYHRLGETKYLRLEKSSSLKIIPPTAEHMDDLRLLAESCGTEAIIGG
jgi:pyruvate formate lyase activating enzyme